MNFQIERLKRLPQRMKETWQGGLTKMPVWVRGGDDAPYRPWIAGWISIKTKLVHTTKPKAPQEKSLEMALDALAEFACNEETAGYRPGKIQVKDSALAELLGRLLAETGIVVEHRKKLFTFEQMIHNLAEIVDDTPRIPNALDVKGVTVELMWAFADAASQFYRAKPWQHLTNEDLIEIESPFVDANLRYLTVLGSGGTTFGLCFFDSVAEYESLHLEPEPSFSGNEYWSVVFSPLTELPFGDADLWEDHGLPVADKDAYPAAIFWQTELKQRRPGPDILCHLEGLMRALAQTTEDEMDSARWKKNILTTRNKMEFTLSLPDLLKPEDEVLEGKAKFRGAIFDRHAMERTQLDLQRMLDTHEFESVDQMQEFLNENATGREIPHREGTTALEQAQDIIYQASEARGRRQLHLLRKALEICPDCADAYVLLAERCPDLEKSRDYYAEGVAAGERALGEDFFKDQTGHFWGIVQTRPYMRARYGLAQCLETLGNPKEAVEHYRELMRLNPNDNQGVRHALLGSLLEIKADDEAEELLKQCKGDKRLAVWSFSRALLTFRQKGDTATARKHLKEAIEANRYVSDYLLDYEELPDLLPPSYRLGSQEEASICAVQLLDAWEGTESALDWLEKHIAKP